MGPQGIRLAALARVKELEQELAELRAEVGRVKAENYADLLDQMDESWGSAREIGRPEINAFLETRAVHLPTTRLRAQVARLREALAAIGETHDGRARQMALKALAETEPKA